MDAELIRKPIPDSPLNSKHALNGWNWSPFPVLIGNLAGGMQSTLVELLDEANLGGSTSSIQGWNQNDCLKLKKYVEERKTKITWFSGDIIAPYAQGLQKMESDSSEAQGKKREVMSTGHSGGTLGITESSRTAGRWDTARDSSCASAGRDPRSSGSHAEHQPTKITLWQNRSAPLGLRDERPRLYQYMQCNHCSVQGGWAVSWNGDLN